MGKRFGFILASFLVLTAALFTSCSRLKERVENVKVTDVALHSFSPEGMRAASAVLDLKIDNPAIQFTVSDLSGTVYRDGVEFATYSAEPLTVKGRRSGVYQLSCSGKLSAGVSLLDVMGLAATRNFNGFTTSVKAKVSTKAGLSKTVSKDNISIADLVKAAKESKPAKDGKNVSRK